MEEKCIHLPKIQFHCKKRRVISTSKQLCCLPNIHDEETLFNNSTLNTGLDTSQEQSDSDPGDWNQAVTLSRYQNPKNAPVSNKAKKTFFQYMSIEASHAADETRQEMALKKPDMLGSMDVKENWITTAVADDDHACSAIRMCQKEPSSQNTRASANTVFDKDSATMLPAQLEGLRCTSLPNRAENCRAKRRRNKRYAKPRPSCLTSSPVHIHDVQCKQRECRKAGVTAENEDQLIPSANSYARPFEITPRGYDSRYEALGTSRINNDDYELSVIQHNASMKCLLWLTSCADNSFVKRVSR